MSKSIAVFGAGPGLGQAVARRYARGGYTVTLVGRRSEPLDRLAKDLTSAGATAHVITADLSDTGAAPRLAERIRAEAGHLDAFYYAKLRANRSGRCLPSTPNISLICSGPCTARRNRWKPSIRSIACGGSVPRRTGRRLPPRSIQGSGKVVCAVQSAFRLDWLAGPSPRCRVITRHQVDGRPVDLVEHLPGSHGHPFSG